MIFELTPAGCELEHLTKSSEKQKQKKKKKKKDNLNSPEGESCLHQGGKGTQ
jgi:hypothetical protein